jgi:hypothetical protein
MKLVSVAPGQPEGVNFRQALASPLSGLAGSRSERDHVEFSFPIPILESVLLERALGERS